MKHTHALPEPLLSQALGLEEFANGAAQCQAELEDGSVHSNLLVSNAEAIVAMRGHKELPFAVESIVRLFQEAQDRNPTQRGGWEFFDNWLAKDSPSGLD